MFRFAIRDVLWLTVVVALAVGLLKATSDRARLADESRRRSAAQSLVDLSIGWKQRHAEEVAKRAAAATTAPTPPEPRAESISPE